MKVVLGGEGADELHGGYPTYLGARHAGAMRVIPRPMRRLLAKMLGGGASHGNLPTRWLLRRLLEGAGLPPVERHLAWFGAFTPDEQVRLFRPEARPAILAEGLFVPAYEAAGPALATGDPIDALLRMDLLLHLPDALLAKVDRATMLESLEARAPFFERALVEHAARLPASWKVRGLTTKVVLREALEGVVPEPVLRRRKRGFAVPVGRALCGALGDRLLDSLASNPLARDRLDGAVVRGWLEEHRAGRAEHSRRLYALLALLAWSERWLRPLAATPTATASGTRSART